MIKEHFGGDLRPKESAPSSDVAETRRLLVGLLEQLDDTGELKLPSTEARLSFARRIYRTRQMRKQFFSEDIFRDPAWDIMLFLYGAGGPAGRFSLSAVATSAGTPYATGFRWVQQLEAAGLVRREPNPDDRRVTWVELTDEARKRLDTFFDSSLRRVFGAPA